MILGLNFPQSVPIQFYAGGSCYKSWSGTNEVWAHGNLAEVCLDSNAMIPAQLETKEEAEKVNVNRVSDVLNFPLSGGLALVTVTSET